MPSAAHEYRKGLVFIIFCYLFWGLFPLYWFPLRGMDPYQIMAQRIAWSLFFLLFLTLITKQLPLVKSALTTRKIVIPFMATSALLFVNWLVYLWAISSDHVLDASLGYYINPLVSIFLGRIVLKEKLSMLHYWAIFIATLGVIWLAVLGQKFPFVALILAFSFGFYALIKKKVSLKTIPGLTIESLFMAPFAFIYLTIEAVNGRLFFFSLPTIGMLVLAFSGIATTIPLLLFSEATRKIPLSLIGIAQYISPTLQFIVGLYFFNENFSQEKFIGFFMVWIAVAIFIYAEWKRYYISKC